MRRSTAREHSVGSTSAPGARARARVCVCMGTCARVCARAPACGCGRQSEHSGSFRCGRSEASAVAHRHEAQSAGPVVQAQDQSAAPAAPSGHAAAPNASQRWPYGMFGLSSVRHRGCLVGSRPSAFHEWSSGISCFSGGIPDSPLGLVVNRQVLAVNTAKCWRLMAKCLFIPHPLRAA